MAQLEKFIKVTQEQYNTLQAGGTVGSHTGINPNFIYLVENNGDSEGGTVVEANPTDEATEQLNTLKVGDTTYSVSNTLAIPAFDLVPETVDETTPPLFRVGIDLYYTGINQTKGYLTFTASGFGRDSDWYLMVNTEAQYDGSLEYSTDAISWTEVTKGAFIYSTNSPIYLRGINNTYCKADQNGQVFSMGYHSYSEDFSIECDGNIETLLDYQTVLNGDHPPMAEACFARLFGRCSYLTKAPELPTTTLSPYCYQDMFFACPSLTILPELPATILAEGCYAGMFRACYNLTKSLKKLPAMTLAPKCYYQMFSSCENLTQAPALPATVLAPYCYEKMFDTCISLTITPALPATILAEGCYQYMFNYCETLTQAPTILPATTLAASCYYGMFKQCPNLTIAPALPATTLAEYCYGDMFCACVSLTQASALPATTLAEGCY